MRKSGYVGKSVNGISEFSNWFGEFPIRPGRLWFLNETEFAEANTNKLFIFCLRKRGYARISESGFPEFSNWLDQFPNFLAILSLMKLLPFFLNILRAIFMGKSVT